MKAFLHSALALALLSCGKKAQLSSPTKDSPVSREKRTLSCNANFQPGGPGTEVSSKELAVEKEEPDSLTLAIDHQGYYFRVNWHYALTTLYVFIRKGDIGVVSATARVPDPNHNDSMVDVFGPPRIWLSCDIVEYRPKP